ncbi:MAG TPA: DUF4908 domain-containing protein [Rhizomicrobium sp.]|jgi:hypothetical protein|nr:DUF4908 domain-containing protein [Rhizomicrobium sp.]
MNARAISILLGLTHFGLALWGANGAMAQEPSDPMAARLSAERVSDVAVGDYTAAEDINFTILPYGGDKYLLRFDDSPENFVLASDRVALGGRELRYDTGALALKISVWGGVTLYTQDAPGGVPATRTGDALAPPRFAVSAANLTAAFNDEESHLSYAQKLKLHFSADAAILKDSDDVRAYAFDALVNSALGIERLIATPAGRTAFTKRFDAVRIVEGDKPTIAISGRTLLVSFVPSAGASGRASSRAITLALGKILAVPEPG